MTTTSPDPETEITKTSAPVEATETKPTETKPTESKPTESKPTESKPTETKPTEAKPTDTKPVQEATAMSAKGKTIPKSIRLWASAFSALKVLMGKYGKNMVDMASTAIIDYAELAAAAPIVRYKIMDKTTLFPLQASATDIRTGLSNFRNDLYNARKSHRDLEELRLAYTMLSAKYQAILVHADATLTLMDKECLLRVLLTPSDHTLLIQALESLERAKPKNRTAMQLRDLHLKIYKTLLP